MSEQSGGPGWWQASDGKWYPPEQASVVPPAPAPTQAVPPVYGGPPAAPAYGAPVGAAAAAGGGGSGKVIAIVVAVALLAGCGAFLLTRGGSSSGGSVASFCSTAKKFQNDANLSNAFNDPKNVDKALAAFDQLTKSAPSEIKADMNTLNDAVKKIGGAVKSAGSDQGKQATAVLSVFGQLDQAKLEAAGKHLDDFGKKNCGADFSFSEGSDDSSSLTFSSSSFDTDSFSSFSSFDTDSLSSSASSASESLCSEFGSDLGSDFCSSS